MTQQRLEQLRGNLANLRDSTDNYIAAGLAQDVIRRCGECGGLLGYLSPCDAAQSEGNAVVLARLRRELQQEASDDLILAVALDIAAMEEENDEQDFGIS